MLRGGEAVQAGARLLARGLGRQLARDGGAASELRVGSNQRETRLARRAEDRTRHRRVQRGDRAVRPVLPGCARDPRGALEHAPERRKERFAAQIIGVIDAKSPVTPVGDPASQHTSRRERETATARGSCVIGPAG